MGPHPSPTSPVWLKRWRRLAKLAMDIYARVLQAMYLLLSVQFQPTMRTIAVEMSGLEGVMIRATSHLRHRCVERLKEALQTRRADPEAQRIRAERCDHLNEDGSTAGDGARQERARCATGDGSGSHRRRTAAANGYGGLASWVRRRKPLPHLRSHPLDLLRQHLPRQQRAVQPCVVGTQLARPELPPRAAGSPCQKILVQ